MNKTKTFVEQFEIKDHGDYFAMVCPVCGQHTGFLYKNNPQTIYCNRKTHCGEETSLKTVLEENGIVLSEAEFIAQVSSECAAQEKRTTGTQKETNPEILLRFFS